MWERYCRDVNAIIFVVDAADKDALPVAKEELLALLEKDTLAGIPLLVLGNKSDLREKMSVDELIEGLELKKVIGREISCYGVSAKEETNLEAVLQVSDCLVDALPTLALPSCFMSGRRRPADSMRALVADREER